MGVRTFAPRAVLYICALSSLWATAVLFERSVVTSIYHRGLYFLYGYTHMFMVVGIVSNWPLRSSENTKARTGFIKIVLFSSAICLQFLATAFSNNGTVNSFRGLVLSLPLSLIVWHTLADVVKERLRFTARNKRVFLLAVLGISIAIFVFGLYYKWDHSYRDSKYRELFSEKFTTSKLLGICSTKEHVEDIETLLEFTSKRLREGILFLCIKIYLCCILMFKHNKGILPTLFNDVFVLSTTTHKYSPMQILTYNIPFCRTNYRQSSLAYVGSKMWNTLIMNNSLQYSATLHILKRRLKHLLLHN
jgi:hypothetical protein